MSKASATTTRRSRADRLGPVLHRLRVERNIPASKMSEQTGLSRSYLNYLEHGRFKEVGVDKFARLVMAMRLSADQVLTEAGYLMAKPTALPDPESYLRSRYKLSPANLEVAMKFLEFLAAGKKRKPKAAKEPSRPR